VPRIFKNAHPATATISVTLSVQECLKEEMNLVNPIGLSKPSGSVMIRRRGQRAVLELCRSREVPLDVSGPMEHLANGGKQTFLMTLKT
jgi:hypothetical protein